MKKLMVENLNLNLNQKKLTLKVYDQKKMLSFIIKNHY